MELTRTETEQQIKDIDLILKNYDSLIQFLWKYENENIHTYDCKAIFVRHLYHIEIEDILKNIKSELELI